MTKRLAILLSIMTQVCGLSAQVVPVTGIVARYGFNGNANDSSGNGYHLTVNGATLCPDRYGRSNSAYQFDGIDDFLFRSTALPQGSDFTYSAWFYSEDLNQRGLIFHNGDGPTNGVGVMQNGGTSSAGSQPGDQITWFCGGVNFFASVQTDLNTWHHIAVTGSGSNYSYYYDNVLVGSGVAMIIPPNGPFYLGYQYFVPNLAFRGRIDDVTVYDRVLTPQDIDTLFHGCGEQFTVHPANIGSGAGGTVQFFASHQPGVVSYQWQMNSGTGFVNLSDAGVYSGTSTDTLKLSGFPALLHNNKFRVIVTNDVNCSDTSLSAVLTVWPAGIGGLEAERTVAVYPNPSDGELTIDLRGLKTVSGRMFIVIYDLAVRKVFEQELGPPSGQHKLYHKFAPGLYLLQLQDSEGKAMWKEKLIVQ